MFPDLEEVAFCSRCPMHPSSALLSAHLSYMPYLAAGPCGSQNWCFGLLVGGTRTQDFLGLVPTHWWVRLVPELLPAHW